MSNPLGRYASDVQDGLVDVRLIDMPLRIWLRTTEHHDELMRELSLLALSPEAPAGPTRLLELIDVLGNQYGAATARPEEERDAALAQGKDRLDLTFRVPSSAAEAAASMRALLVEVDDYCQSDLLTLAQTPLQSAFAQWYIDQFVDQVAGKPPTPWPGPWT